MELPDIIKELQGSPSVGKMADLKVYIAAEYAFLSMELEKVLTLKQARWLMFRESRTSDTQAEREWGRTAEGLHEISLRLRLKAMEKLMSALTTRINVAEGEARNQF